MSFTLRPQNCERFECSVCTIYLNAENNGLRLTATHGLSASSIGHLIPNERWLVGKVSREKKPHFIAHSNVHRENYKVEGSGEEVFKSFFEYPIITPGGNVVGVMVLQNKRPSKFFLKKEILEIESAVVQVSNLVSAQPALG